MIRINIDIPRNYIRHPSFVIGSQLDTESVRPNRFAANEGKAQHPICGRHCD
jgi:hypothetical protein